MEKKRENRNIISPASFSKPTRIKIRFDLVSIFHRCCTGNTTKIKIENTVDAS